MSDNVTMFIGFDGTGNHRDNDQKIGDGSQSNVAELVKLYDNGKNEVFYKEGVGTVELTADQITLVKEGKAVKNDFYNSEEMAFGIGVKDKVTSMLNDISDPIKNVKALGKTVIIDVAGFSRGAASSRDFVNEFHKTYASEIQSGQIVLNNVILFDTVATVGLSNSYNESLNLNLDENSAKNIIHFTAKDEKRDNFSLESLRDENGNLPSNIKEILLSGVHSNLGGGYAQSLIENIVIDSGIISYVSQGELSSIMDSIIQQGNEQGYSTEFKEYTVTYKDEIYTQYKYNYIETKTITNELANVSLQLAYDELSKTGTNLNDISTLNKEVPEELQEYYNAIKNGETDLSEYENVVEKYIHDSSHNENGIFSSPKEKFLDWLANRGSDGERTIFSNNSDDSVNGLDLSTYSNHDNIVKAMFDFIESNLSIQIDGISHIYDGALDIISEIRDYLIDAFNLDDLFAKNDALTQDERMTLAQMINAGGVPWGYDINSVRRIDPLVLDLNHDGIINTSNLSTSDIFFDLDDNGMSERTA